MRCCGAHLAWFFAGFVLLPDGLYQLVVCVPVVQESCFEQRVLGIIARVVPVASVWLVEGDEGVLVRMLSLGQYLIDDDFDDFAIIPTSIGLIAVGAISGIADRHIGYI